MRCARVDWYGLDSSLKLEMRFGGAGRVRPFPGLYLKSVGKIRQIVACVVNLVLCLHARHTREAALQYAVTVGLELDERKRQPERALSYRRNRGCQCFSLEFV
jgi:hypothetical protein